MSVPTHIHNRVVLQAGLAGVLTGFVVGVFVCGLIVAGVLLLA